MSARPCAELAEHRSALVDGALDEQDQERLLRHLVDCAPCRRDVAALRSLRELISRAPDHSRTPADLSARLVSIAGSAQHEPVTGRRFRRTRGDAWPTTRRAARWRAVTATVAVAASVAVVGVSGYLAAPTELATISDPSAEAEAEFSSAVGRSPLHTDAVGATLLAHPAGLAATAALGITSPALPTGDQISAMQTRAMLERAATAADSVSYAGEQIFTVRRPTQDLTARLRVVNLSGQGSEVRVVNAGSPMLSGFAPAASSTRLVDTSLLNLLERNYVLSGSRGSVVLGRSATMLQATRDGQLASRWWVDDETGVVLWQDSYDPHGVLDQSVGFTELTFDPPGMMTQLSAPVGLGTTKTALTLTTAEPLNAAGWSCGSELAGLSLVKLRADDSGDPSALHLTYSDGLLTVTVYEQRGRLGADPATFGWDSGLGAYLRRGSANLATWQSGDRVFTVLTDGSPEQLAAAVALLPHQPPRERTTMERIQAGWAKMLAEVKG